MSTCKPNRRDFLKAGTAACLGAPSHVHASGSTPPNLTADLNILRCPDLVFAVSPEDKQTPMQWGSGEWTLPGYVLTTDPVEASGAGELAVRLHASAQGLTQLRLRWLAKLGDTGLTIGDAWERAYGDLEWRGVVPNRILPWFFFTQTAKGTAGYGVKTRPSAFCFWQRDPSGITLTLDIKNGGNPADLRGRDLTLCTVLQGTWQPDVPFHLAAQTFCKFMCPDPRLPKGPIFGANDWNYAYGKNNADGILRDADLIAALAPSGSMRPHIVIDDGWQDRRRFPDMTRLAADIQKRNLQAGLWIRPLRAASGAPEAYLLPASRFGGGSHDAAPAYDPTLPEALALICKSATNPVSWNYTFLKHDFSTYELFGRWGFAMGDTITSPGWNFHNRTQTNAEVVLALYQALREAAGDGTTLLGCNTVGHIAAGIFESQRVGDDTSGTSWERTRRMGVNALAHRTAQHGTFFGVDPDCVAITQAVGWQQTEAWMNVVAATGTSLFLSPSPDATDARARAAMKDAMQLVVEQTGAYPQHPTSSTTPETWVLGKNTSATRTYTWTEDGASPSTDS